MTSLAVIAALALAATPDADVYAVVVGHNGGMPAQDGRPGLPTLRFADDDALRMARWFEAIAVPGGVTVLANVDETTRATLERAGLPIPATRAPTRRGLEDALAELKAKLKASKRPSTVFFFFAGHGLTGRLLLEPEGAAFAAITGKELKLALLDLGADQIELFIDACRSQSLFTERGGGPDLSSEIDALDLRARKATMGVLTASQSDKPAGEASDLMGGFFSHVLASGLAGAADADGDEVVRFGELASFVAFNTEGVTGQRPWFEPPGGSLQAPVISLRGRTRLELPAEIEGRLRVSSPQGAPVFAELNKAKGRAAALMLPPGTYRIDQQLAEGRARSTELSLLAGEAKPLGAFGDATTASKKTGERGDAEWEGGSFQSPFSSSVVAALDSGFVSGQPNVSSGRRVALDAAYVVSAAPFKLPTVEQGAEIGARVRVISGLELGVRVNFRASGAPSLTEGLVAFRRLGVFARAGWRLEPVEWLAITPFFTGGFKSTWRVSSTKTSGDLFSPAFGGGVMAEVRVTRSFGVWLDGRLEAAFITVDGVRSPFAEPGATVGVSLWF
ncbi:MAG: caspase family protein [Archangium sp.]